MDARALKDFKVLLFFVALLWLIELVNAFFGHSLNQFGLVPRTLSRLYGIVTMHFLHGGFTHLLANTLPLVVLGFLVCSTHKGLQVTAIIALLTGCFVWIGARNGMHIGASGLVMGYFGFLISRTFFNRNLKNAILMIVTIVLYGGLLFTLIDFRGWVSFEGHIFGFISGVISAKIWRRQG